MSQLVKAPPRALAPVASAAEAREQLAAARERLARSLHSVEAQVSAVSKTLGWREVVRRHPYLCAGGALLFGYALGRLVSRR